MLNHQNPSMGREIASKKTFKVALVENFGSDFVGARLRFALFLKEQGAQVTAIVPGDGHSETIRKNGIHVVEVNSNVRDKNVFKVLSYARQLRSILKKENFDIVHFYRFQPNIIGTVVAGIFTRSHIVNHITGLGLAFTSKTAKNLFLQTVTKLLYKLNGFFFGPHFICQNEQDIEDLNLKGGAVCIKGSSVNEAKFSKGLKETYKGHVSKIREELNLSNQDDAKVFLFVSRLLREKGVVELIKGFIDATEISNQSLRLILVGWSDPDNPSSVKIDELERLIEGREDITYLGKRTDVHRLISIADVSILPTYYREGVPRFLLESMAMAKPIITTKMPGCEDLIEGNKNGELIEPKDAHAIKNAILNIIDRDMLVLGSKSSEIYHSKYSEKKVYSSILELYNKILG